MTAGAPAGFAYHPDFLTPAEESALAVEIRGLEFGEVRMHGVVARRRTGHFGWRYGYRSSPIGPGAALAGVPLAFRRRARAAALVALEPDLFAEALITEYPAGAAIGWHRDAPQFGPVVVGVSLLGACRFKFQRGQGAARQTCAVSVEPRSAYVLGGAAR